MARRESLSLRFGFGYSTKGFHKFSPVCELLLKFMLYRRDMASTGVLLLLWKIKTHPMSPKDKRHTLGITVEKVSFAVLAVLGIFGLALFTATTLGVLPIISASWALTSDVRRLALLCRIDHDEEPPCRNFRARQTRPQSRFVHFTNVAILTLYGRWAWPKQVLPQCRLTHFWSFAKTSEKLLAVGPTNWKCSFRGSAVRLAKREADEAHWRAGRLRSNIAIDLATRGQDEERSPSGCERN
jgi:hypothetical protein